MNAISFQPTKRTFTKLCSKTIASVKGRCVKAADTLKYLFCDPVGSKFSSTPSPSTRGCVSPKLSARASHRFECVKGSIIGGLYSTAFSLGMWGLALAPRSSLLIGVKQVAVLGSAFSSALSVYKSCRAAEVLLKNRHVLPSQSAHHRASSGRCLASGMALVAGACTAGLMLFSVTNPATGMFYLQSRFLLPTIAHMALHGLGAMAEHYLEDRVVALQK